MRGRGVRERAGGSGEGGAGKGTGGAEAALTEVLTRPLAPQCPCTINRMVTPLLGSLGRRVGLPGLALPALKSPLEHSRSGSEARGVRGARRASQETGLGAGLLGGRGRDSELITIHPHAAGPPHPHPGNPHGSCSQEPGKEDAQRSPHEDDVPTQGSHGQGAQGLTGTVWPPQVHTPSASLHETHKRPHTRGKVTQDLAGQATPRENPPGRSWGPGGPWGGGPGDCCRHGVRQQRVRNESCDSCPPPPAPGALTPAFPCTQHTLW